MSDDHHSDRNGPSTGPSKLKRARFVQDSGSSTPELKPRLRYDQYIESMNPKVSIFSDRNRKRKRTRTLLIIVAALAILALCVYLLFFK